MADPKYADLPGIATDQPDTYETSSDRGHDTDEDSLESEESETLHLSSLSWLGGELEVGGDQETLTQRFTRLRCEVTQLTEDLDSLTESSRHEGSLAGLLRQVSQLRQQLEGCDLGQEGIAVPGQAANQKALLDQLAAQIKDIVPPGGKSSADAAAGTFDLYLCGGSAAAGGSTTTVAELDRQLARLEGLVGAKNLEQRRVLSAETDGLSLYSAVQLLDQRRSAQNAQHLTHVEGRLAALNNRLDALGQQKGLVQKARSASQVAALYDALESRAGMLAVLPEVAARLADVAQLQQGAATWTGRLADVAAQQEVTDRLLAENRSAVSATQQLVTERLGGVLDQVARMQDNLQALTI